MHFLLHQKAASSEQTPDAESDRHAGGVNRPDPLEPKVIPDNTPRLPPVSLTGIYSSSGFDLLGILSWVVHRPNPKIDLGPIDLSCAFLVTDPRKPDNPIIYASETFTKLTGYTNSEVLNRSCRFLQSPDGKQEKGQFRRYTDHTVVAQLKQAVENNVECQFTLINYKKSGEPFINLVTVVPVEYYRPGEVSFFVGFQVDLVDQPQAILDRMKDGTYAINYQIAGHLETRPQRSTALDLATYQEETKDLLASPSIATQLPAAAENLVEESGDFLFILSLRGLFLYAATGSAQRVIEYRAEELMGHNLNEFVHPADFVSVMRELRTTSPGDGVNLLCRFRRKQSGYSYMEINGHIYEGDSNKRTKCFIMSGREIQIPALYMKDITRLDSEMAETWLKLSPEGIILYICQNSMPVTGYEPDDLFGKSLVAFLHDADQPTFRDCLTAAIQTRCTKHMSCTITLKRGYIPLELSLYSSTGTLYCQIRKSDNSNTDLLDSSAISGYSTLYEDGNLFDVMARTAVATSAHYELNQLRIMNKRLRDELESLDAPFKKKVSK